MTEDDRSKDMTSIQSFKLQDGFASEPEHILPIKLNDASFISNKSAAGLGSFNNLISLKLSDKNVEAPDYPGLINSDLKQVLTKIKQD